MPLRTIALITAFSPGQSPPPVSTPSRTDWTITSVIRILGLAKSVSVLVLAWTLLLAGCLSTTDRKEGSRISGDTVTVYSSLPRHGVSAPAAAAVTAGERLAVAEADHRAGGGPGRAGRGPT